MKATKVTENDDLSTFALDVYWASGLAPDPAIEHHLAGCARCRGYIAHLRAIETARASVTLSAGYAISQVAPRRRRLLVRATTSAVVAVGLAAAVALLVHARSAAVADYVGIKGTPGAELLVRHGSDTRVWDGRSAVHPGDVLALRVACEGLGHVAVASPTAAGWKLLSGAACPREGDALPFTLIVDGEPGREILAVVLSRDPGDEESVRKAISGRLRTRDVWVVQFVLPKETGR